MDKYVELRAAVAQNCHALLIEDPSIIRALLAERDALREALTCIARTQTKPGDGKAALLLASVINLAFAALAQGQGEE